MIEILEEMRNMNLGNETSIDANGDDMIPNGDDTEADVADRLHRL